MCFLVVVPVAFVLMKMFTIIVYMSFVCFDQEKNMLLVGLVCLVCGAGGCGLFA